ncbi:CopD family copper resistance protein [Achromobacter anxifer]
MNTYPLLLILHLLAAFLFVGTVSFEVLFLEPVHKRLSPDVRRALGSQLAPRVRSVLPWSVVVLYLAGLGLAWQYRGALAAPFASSFGILLSLKIALALSVLLHVATALTLARRQRLTGALSRRMHVSVFCHMVLIVVLAKAMFHVAW